MMGARPRAICSKWYEALELYAVLQPRQIDERRRGGREQAKLEIARDADHLHRVVVGAAQRKALAERILTGPVEPPWLS
jgi:hypothetical protein